MPKKLKIKLFLISSLILAGLLLTLLYLRNHSSATTRTEKENFIIIMLDALRRDHLGCYGYQRNTSPNIDSIAKDGTIFTQAIGQGSWTIPSIYSLSTSTYPRTHQVYNAGDRLTNGIPVLFKKLRDSGYYLGLIHYKGKLEPFHFPEIEKCFNYFSQYKFHNKSSEEITQEAIEWLKTNKKKNFFLWLFYLPPHEPNDPPAPYDEMFVNDEFGKINDRYVPLADESKKLFEGIGAIPRINSVKNITSLNYYIARYDASIRYVDDLIGALIAELKKMGLYENTTIIITADHGEALGEHNHYFMHSISLYDELIRIPLIIKSKDFPKNAKIDRQIQEIDIMPTLLDIADITPPQSCEGTSLLKLINENYYPIKHAFSEYDMKRSVRTQDWKLIYSLDKDEYELYNLKNDPGETTNLVKIDTKQFEHLKHILWIWFNEKTAGKPAYNYNNDNEAKRKLKSLGYIQ